MMMKCRRGSRDRRAYLLPTVAATAFMAFSASASAQDATVLETGMRVWSEAGCANCHGNQGQGGTSSEYPAGPAFRATALDRETLIEITRCGVPSTRMPAWLEGAYTDVPCFGMELGQPPARTIVIGAFDAAEVEAVVDYILATFAQR